MDLYFLNFKRILVVITSKDMRRNLLDLIQEHEVDVNIKFVNSYFDAANLINENKHDPYDHIVLNLSVSNRKLNDFVEFITPTIETNPNYLLEYTNKGELSLIDLIQE